MDSKKEILFICHEASRTGAPLLLLRFLQWLREHTDLSFRIIIIRGGVLNEAFAILAPTEILRPISMGMMQKIWMKLHFRSFVRSRIQDMDLSRVGLIYANTFASGLLIPILKKETHAPVMTHVHELERTIQSTGSRSVKRVMKGTDRFMAASEAVRENLIKAHGIEPGRVEVHYSCILTVADRDEPLPEIPEKVLRGTRFLVGNAGMVDPLKGYEVFLQTAHEVIHTRGHDHIGFIWVGAFGRGKQEEVRQLINDLHLQDHVWFTGELEDPFPVFRMLDLFFLSSHEDSFPLVMLENASLGNPVIAFRGTGGSGEFLKGYPELMIADIDPVQAADKIIHFSTDPDSCQQVGRDLKKRVLDHFTMDTCAAGYYRFVKKMMGIE